ncbi:hypothetical protein AXG93_523s1110 [Marchantia polymorpha subsp. ruderalis]|uniref:Uncharacterized protein n=1 Tax=Marchantia polymorpha subsp. ruderalis TaxID=1480154 RepID=A0A176VW77_MARPO|nr:hypothetical protein AXG93_523s1110 [Marchantia polymorpha subsp. ruderalis]
MVKIREVRLWELEPPPGLQTLKGGEFRLTVDLLSKLKACTTVYDAESLQVDELSAAAEKKGQEYQIELAIKSHNGLRLREFEHRATELIARSRRRHRRLAKKLKSYVSRSRDAVANLE